MFMHQVGLSKKYDVQSDATSRYRFRFYHDATKLHECWNVFLGYVWRVVDDCIERADKDVVQRGHSDGV